MVLRRADELRAEVDDLAAGDRAVEHPPADAVARLEHRDRAAGARDLARGDEPGEAGADDDDVLARRARRRRRGVARGAGAGGGGRRAAAAAAAAAAPATKRRAADASLVAPRLRRSPRAPAPVKRATVTSRSSNRRGDRARPLR